MNHSKLLDGLVAYRDEIVARHARILGAVEGAIAAVREHGRFWTERCPAFESVPAAEVPRLGGPSEEEIREAAERGRLGSGGSGDLMGLVHLPGVDIADPRARFGSSDPAEPTP